MAALLDVQRQPGLAQAAVEEEPLELFGAARAWLPSMVLTNAASTRRAWFQRASRAGFRQQVD